MKTTARNQRSVVAGATAVYLMWQCLAWVPAYGDPDTAHIDDGVLIAHHSPEVQYSAGIDLCREYVPLSSCDEQHNRIDLDGGLGQLSVWYVIAAFVESTTWGGAEFGLGEYSPSIFGFIDWGPCFPSHGLEIHSEGWPGPQQGTAFVTTDLDYTGNFLPIYHFVGYAYAQGVIPLGVDPAKDFGGTLSKGYPMIMRHAEAFGSMGIFEDGEQVHPAVPRAEQPEQFTREMIRERVIASEKRGREIPAIAKAMDIEFLRSVLDQLPPEIVDRLRRGPLGPELGLRAPEDSLEKQEGQ